jgi:hypothetical protein
MSSIKFKKEIETLIKNKDRIPEEFWVRTDGQKYQVIWFMSRQKPSVSKSYDFDEERFGLTKDGRVIWGFHSGCSCPSPWSQSDHGDEKYMVSEWKEFTVPVDQPFDAGWEDECYSNLQDYLMLITKKLDPARVVNAKNAEVRRFLPLIET